MLPAMHCSIEPLFSLEASMAIDSVYSEPFMATLLTYIPIIFKDSRTLELVSCSPFLTHTTDGCSMAQVKVTLVLSGAEVLPGYCTKSGSGKTEREGREEREGGREGEREGGKSKNWNFA